MTRKVSLYILPLYFDFFYKTHTIYNGDIYVVLLLQFNILPSTYMQVPKLLLFPGFRILVALKPLYLKYLEYKCYFSYSSASVMCGTKSV